MQNQTSTRTVDNKYVVVRAFLSQKDCNDVSVVEAEDIKTKQRVAIKITNANN